MKIKLIPILAVLLLGALGCKQNVAISPDNNYIQFVNPFIGTDGTGHTFPGAAYPLGMVQPGPDTYNHSWDHTSGYQYDDTHIMGFSQNHLSGTGISDLGDILLQPFSTLDTPENFKSRYNKETETASPGYYSVTLTDHDVQVELTSSERVAFHRYSYKGNSNKLYIDFQHGIVNNWIPLDEHVVDAFIEIASETQISGMIETKSWVQHKTFFVIEFNEPFSEHEILPKTGSEKAPKYILNFNDLPDQQLLVKVALSTVSVEGALKNLKSEVDHWEFDEVLTNTETEWNNYLKRIHIAAPQKQKEIFYTGLYHLFIQPNATSDIDGKYRGYDDEIYTAVGDVHYSTFSLWDTYRAAHPLYTILAPEKVDDFVNSLIAQHEVQGFLPIWGLMNKETYTMIGNHAIPVVADAVLKGIENIDAETAYQAIFETSTINHKNSVWDIYEKYGYYPYDLMTRDGESVSRTLEHTVDDHAVALLANHLNKQADYQRFLKRSSYYRNLFDKSTGFMRGRDSEGNWRPNFDPLVATSPMNNPGDYTEANAYQYSWAAQHDTEGMVGLFGSREAMIAKLDEFFTTETKNPDIHLGQEAMIGQYAHGNEPSHHIAYLYQLLGAPEKTRRLVTTIYNQFYDNTPEGIAGNEDCGQMSAWYIFSTLGFYPVHPANGKYVLGIPQVEKANIQLPDNKMFVIYGSSKSDSLSVELNEHKTLSTTILHQDIMMGGELRFIGH